MNFCKFAIMTWAYFFLTDPTLVTFGDAVANFLDNPAPSTASRCLMTKDDVDSGPLKWQGLKDQVEATPLPQTYRPSSQKRWFRAASTKRWVTTVGVVFAALVTGIALLVSGVQHLRGVGVAGRAFQLGFGKIDSRMTINTSLPSQGAAGLVCSVLLANAPQVRNPV